MPRPYFQRKSHSKIPSGCEFGGNPLPLRIPSTVPRFCRTEKSKERDSCFQVSYKINDALWGFRFCSLYSTAYYSGDALSSGKQMHWGFSNGKECILNGKYISDNIHEAGGRRSSGICLHLDLSPTLPRLHWSVPTCSWTPKEQKVYWVKLSGFTKFGVITLGMLFLSEPCCRELRLQMCSSVSQGRAETRSATVMVITSNSQGKGECSDEEL